MCLAALLTIVAVFGVLRPAATASADLSAEGGMDARKPDRKPQLYQMLAYNDRIDTQNDELRMDFILRVAHGLVNPECVPEGAISVSGADKCGLNILYSYYGVGKRVTQYNHLHYLNTLGENGAGASRWASNVDGFYTIHTVINSGAYDYLNISMECDIDYPNDASPGSYDPGATDFVDTERVGGARINQYVYATVGDDGKPWANTDSISFDAAASLDPERSTNIAADHPAYVYTPYCSPGSAYPACNGPMSFIGWDANPALWSGGQANWGLVTDHGFAGRPERAGVAPSKSFFVYWYNPDQDTGKRCSRNTSFYYQWLGTKAGKWVPVSSLTPQVQRVDGQKRVVAAVPPPDANASSSFNEPVRSDKKNYLLAPGPGAGKPSAQHADGSIDFKLAKEADGLDGYFKLVTWPITTNPDGSITGCDAEPMKDFYNPDAGISADMDQHTIAERISMGWTVDTAYYRYDVARPDRPVISSPKDGSYAGSLTPLISGSGEPGDLLSLYAQDPAKPIKPDAPDDPDTKGVLIGRTTVAEDGTWAIRDPNTASPANTESGTRRYHAWQTETSSGYDLTSEFSNTVTVHFMADKDPAPKVTSVAVPHTVNGVLPDGSKLTLAGTAAPIHDGDALKVYALPDPDGAGRTGAAEGKESTEAPQTRTSAVSHARKAPTLQTPSGGPEAGPMPDTAVVARIESIPAGDQQWELEAEPKYFLDRQPADGKGETFRFVAVLVNRAGAESASRDFAMRVDMDPPDPGVSASDLGQVSGKAVGGRSHSPEPGARISVTWPDGGHASTVADGQGAWSISTPAGMRKGEVTVRAEDAADNQSAPRIVQLTEPANVGSLPLAGGHGWMVYAGLAVGFLGAVVVRRLREQAGSR
ncbi:hypothetical protein CRD59_04985 [Bifidobacterium xylocopae]|uniref:Bacterial Ig domain-containing protein n=1 Tax=Bifidobacterium xylocopae TaxID=2493119 RepID=A0A366KBW8_9BIFI|nr:hypothetical protein CRD59_04985 [Bifidobacterium xylocopae]